LHWSTVTLAYLSYLAVVSWLRPTSPGARGRVLLAAAAAWAAFAGATNSHIDLDALPPALLVALPALILLFGYWLSGLFFTSPDPAIEQRLLRLDSAVLARLDPGRWSRGGLRFLLEWLELSYLLVYLLLPAGAVVAVIAGAPGASGRFWTVVLLAEFACYAALPWIQTRPPRVLEDPVGSPPAIGVRRLNLAIARRASIQANTLPSAHAAGAVAAALCVIEVSPNVGAAFMVVATSIAVATVVGRYHYLLDSILGGLVGAAAWAVVY
jgi:membrane-associated phospholipid phosphatase